MQFDQMGRRWTSESKRPRRWPGRTLPFAALRSMVEIPGVSRRLVINRIVSM